MSRDYTAAWSGWAAQALSQASSMATQQRGYHPYVAHPTPSGLPAAHWVQHWAQAQTHQAPASLQAPQQPAPQLYTRSL